MIRKTLLVLLIFLSFLSFTFSQNHEFSKKTSRHDYDSLWYFYLFSIDLSAGIWTPVGKLSHYYVPSSQFGGSLGFMLNNHMRFQLWIMPRVLIHKSPIGIKVNDSIVNVSKSEGASLGGWLSYTLYQNRKVSTELITGITWEDIGTNIENPHRKKNSDSLLSVAAVGLSIGGNTWFNTFPRLNFGLKVVYTYATYNYSKNLAHPIGGHSLTVSLVYRVQRRNLDYGKYY